LIFALQFVDEAAVDCTVKSAWMTILGLAATDEAFEADLQIDDASRYELRRKYMEETFGAKIIGSVSLR